MKYANHYLLEVALGGAPLVSRREGSRRHQLAGCTIGYWGTRSLIEELPAWLGLIDGSMSTEVPGPALFEELRAGCRAPPVGLYNVIGVEPSARRMTIATDAFGMLPCYLHVGAERLLVSSSLVMLAEAAGLVPDVQGVAERYALCWPIGSRTEVSGASLVPPGSVVSLDWSEGQVRRGERRTSSAWRYHDDRPSLELVNDFYRVWQDAVARSLPKAPNARVGLMLSGGLDSRLILAEMTRQGVVPTCCTHGDLESDEAELARRCASIVSAPMVTNALDASVGFDQLGLQYAFETTGLIFNPIWARSAEVMAAHGLTHVASGCLGDSLLGGSYYWYGDQRARLAINLARSFGARLLPDEPLDERTANGIADLILGDARKRFRYHSILLRPELREACLARLPMMRASVIEVLDRYRREGAISWQQALERFKCEHRIRKYLAGQELLVGTRLRVLAPFADRDALTLMSNMSPRTKGDHAVYYAVFRKYYRQLAQVPVANLNGPVSRPLIAIEALRAGVRLRDRVRGKPEHRSWINFEQWMREGRMPAYEGAFLACETAFDPIQVRAYFDEVRTGKRGLYDGNETMNFLAVGRLLQQVHTGPSNPAWRNQ